MAKAESLTVYRRELVYKHNLRLTATAPKRPSRAARRRHRKTVQNSRRINRGQRRRSGR